MLSRSVTLTKEATSPTLVTQQQGKILPRAEQAVTTQTSQDIPKRNNLICNTRGKVQPRGYSPKE